MNLLLLQPADLGQQNSTPCDSTQSLSSTGSPDTSPRSGVARVDGERLQHLRKVLKVKVGDKVKAGFLNGLIGEAEIQAIDRDGATLAFDLHTQPPPPLDVDLYLALPRPKFLGRILQHATTAGVKRIVLFHSARVEKSYWSSNLLTPEALHRHLCLGLEQGRDTILPGLLRLESFVDAVDDASKRSAQGAAILVADGDSSTPFPRAPKAPTALVIGPEGGLVDREIQAFEKIGAHCCSLGPRPLRVEAAVSVCLGRLLPDPC